MATDRWSRIGELFHAARDLRPELRADFLRRACGDDSALRKEVASLLRHHERPAEFLDASAPSMLSDGTRPERSDPALGRRVGAYQIEARIAAGGMGTVYRGTRCDGVLEQTVAIKLMHPWRTSPELVQRFQREWQTLADLAHPNIARVLDAGLADGDVPYLVMEYLDGEPLDAYCATHHIDLPGRLELVEVIARTVHFAHQNLVVHRDLKPANILVTTAGVPKLLDFGIAKILRPNARDTHALTATQSPMMTPDYASPEQIRGAATTTATDVYSLGVLLYELLCGHRPYRDTTSSADRVERILSDREPPKPSTTVDAPSTHQLRRQLRGDLDNVIMTAMRKDPARRYPSADRFADDIRAYLSGRPVAARPDSIIYRTKKFVVRNRLASAAGAIAAVAILTGTATTAWQASVAAAERDDARASQTIATLERDHARIEADSSVQVARILSEAFLVLAGKRPQQDLDDVRELLERNVFRVRREHADKPHERANLLDAIGRVYLDLDMFDAAAELIDESASIREGAFGSESLEVALSEASRGNLDYQRGAYEDAVVHFEKALRLQRSLPRGVHTDIAKSANDLAVALRLVGRVAEAESLHEEALALRREQQNGDHPLVAESLNNLAAVYRQKGELVRAESCLRDAAAMRRAVLGERDPLVAQTLNNLAAVAFELGRPDDARRAFEEAIELYRSVPGIGQDRLAVALTNYASLLRRSGDPEAALRAGNEALELRRGRIGDEPHPSIADTYQVLAEAAHALGEHDEAARYFEDAVAIKRQVYPPGHRAIGEALCNYGAVMVTTAGVSAALPVLRESVEILRGVQPTPGVFLAAAENRLGKALLELRRFEQAEPYLLAAHRRLDARHTTQRERIRQRLVTLYRAWGKPDRASAFRKD